MTIDKAIGMLSDAGYGHSLTTSSDFYDAIKLGVEALIRIKEWRRFTTKTKFVLLPGETKWTAAAIKQQNSPGTHEKK